MSLRRQEVTRAVRDQKDRFFRDGKKPPPPVEGQRRPMQLPTLQQTAALLHYVTLSPPRADGVGVVVANTDSGVGLHQRQVRAGRHSTLFQVHPAATKTLGCGGPPINCVIGANGNICGYIG